LCLLCLFTAPPPTGLYSLSLHDALPILMRIGLQGNLGQDDRIKVVGEAASGEDAVRLSRQLKPDVVLMDLGLPGISGLESTERILKAQPHIRIVVLTAHSEPPLPARLLDSGASGYLTKACNADELVEAVHAVSRGERYIGANISQQLALSLLPVASKTPFQELTARELEVALMLMQGMKARVIGE